MLVGGVLEAGQTLPRNDEYVHRRLRFDVAEGDAVLVLIDDVGGDLASQNSVEDGVVCHSRRVTFVTIVVYS